MPFDGDVAISDLGRLQGVRDVTSLALRLRGQGVLVELEQHVRKVNDHAPVGLPDIEVLSLQLFDELTVAGELTIPSIHLLIPRLELIADDGPGEAAELAA